MMTGSGPVARFTFLFAVVLILQVSVMPQITLQGVVIDLLVAIAVLGGMNGGSERGAVIGFVAGLIADLLVHTPFGIIAMVLTLTGHAAGSLVVPVASSGRVVRSLIAGGLTTCSVLVFVLIAWLLELTYVTENGVLRIAIINGIVVALLNPLGERAVRWALLVRPNLRESRAV